MRKSIAAVAVPAALAAVAVGSPAGADVHAARGKTVTVGDDFYSPTKIRIKLGTVLKWAWQGHTDDPHTVSDLRGSWSSKEMHSGSYRHRFNKAGRFTVLCMVHPDEMRIRVTVKR